MENKYEFFNTQSEPIINKIFRRGKNNYFLHILLFLCTFFTTTISGVQWLNVEKFYELEYFHLGLAYSLSLLFILSCHEFGHYFASKIHKVDATLPFYIPIPTMEGMLNFGTLGAVIKTRTVIPSKKAMFDIGSAGPIAGFIASILVLIWGFTHLPGIDYLYNIHPEYVLTGVPENGLTFGNSILYWLLSHIFVNPSITFLPPLNEIYHYPFLCTGWFGLFVTGMNMLPVGQLDGGHVVFAMFGHKIHKYIARAVFLFLVIFGLIGFLQLIDERLQYGWSGWFIWAIILFFVVKIEHPHIGDEYEELDRRRKIIGWFTLLIFGVTFMPVPFILS